MEKIEKMEKVGEALLEKNEKEKKDVKEKVLLK